MKWAKTGTSKYRNVKTVVNGITFDGKAEAERYTELMLMLGGGEIKDLKLQPTFTLCEAYTTPDGEKIKSTKYIADFSYLRKTAPDANGDTYWVPVVEDVKGVETDAFKLKERWMLEKYGIRIVKVKK
jgi:hypothetical protein